MPSVCPQSLAMLKYEFRASRACVRVCRVTGPSPKASPGSAQVTASKNLIGWRSRRESAAWRAINLCATTRAGPSFSRLGMGVPSDGSLHGTGWARASARTVMSVGSFLL